jgi:hypothetical protein
LLGHRWTERRGFFVSRTQRRLPRSPSSDCRGWHQDRPCARASAQGGDTRPLAATRRLLCHERDELALSHCSHQFWEGIATAQNVLIALVARCRLLARPGPPGRSTVRPLSEAKQSLSKRPSAFSFVSARSNQSPASLDGPDACIAAGSDLPVGRGRAENAEASTGRCDCHRDCKYLTISSTSSATAYHYRACSMSPASPFRTSMLGD